MTARDKSRKSLIGSSPWRPPPACVGSTCLLSALAGAKPIACTASALPVPQRWHRGVASSAASVVVSSRRCFSARPPRASLGRRQPAAPHAKVRRLPPTGTPARSSDGWLLVCQERFAHLDLLPQQPHDGGLNETLRQPRLLVLLPHRAGLDVLVGHHHRPRLERALVQEAAQRQVVQHVVAKATNGALLDGDEHLRGEGAG
eukprot:scaffold32506_cov112-Isochrysis_galbana.AAC.5